MQYVDFYDSELGKIILTSDGCALTGLWFADGKYSYFESRYEERKLLVFKETKRWLDLYFLRKNPSFIPKMHLTGSPFQLKVWEILKQIPYGKVMTYKEIAQMIAKEYGIPKMSAQAVGGAVGKNKISLIIPCHRVIGTNGSLTGYAGGVDKKSALLTIEHAKI